MNEPIDYARGEYRVGTHCFSFTDVGRRELLGGVQDYRRVTVRMYYPVTEASVAGKKRARIFSPSKLKAVQKSLFFVSFKPEDLTADYYHVPMMRGRKFPLIFFSHGYGSYVEANTFICCFLASRGYVVASVGHAFEAMENTYAHGSFDLMDKTLGRKMYTDRRASMKVFNRLKKSSLSRMEALAVFDAYQDKYAPFMKGRVAEWAKDTEAALREIKKRYSDCIDFTRGVGASGHSLGGATAYYLCRYNDEFTCGINIDGALYGDYDDSPMKAPFCQICCKEHLFCMTRPLLGTEAPAYLVTFDGTRHVSYCDIGFKIKSRLLMGRLSAEEIFENLSYTHLTFFDRYLKGSDADLEQTASRDIRYERVDSL